MRVYRIWINQPSTLQKFNYLHGKRGIAIKQNSTDKEARVYFTEGSLQSILLPTNILSEYFK